jgi:ABC-type dipeptide/oligopeptide/nickel transport system permease component
MAIPPQENPEVVGEIIKHWNALWKAFIPVILGTVVAMIVNLPIITKRKRFVDCFLNIISVILTGAVSSLLGVFALSILYGNPSAEMEMLAAGISGAAGQRGIDMWTKHVFGFSITRNETRANPEKKWDGEERRKGERKE